MKAFIGLLKKDFRLTRTFLLFNVIAVIVLNLGFYLVANSFDNPKAAIPLSLTLIVFHIFYLTAYMFYTLHAEGKKIHLWLHNPQPALILLLSKMMNGLFALVISLTLSYGFLWFFYHVHAFIAISKVNQIALFTYLHIIAFSVLVSIWFVLAWTIYRALLHIVGSKVSLAIAITSYFGFQWLLGKFQESRLFIAITYWGNFKFLDLNHLFGNVSNLTFNGPSEYLPIIPIGIYVFYMIFVVAIFFLSSWLIDRKVEV